MKKFLLIGATSAMVAMWSAGGAFAQSGETPATLLGAKTVSSENVKEILGKAVIVDVRKKASYLEGHLPGAKSAASFYDAEKKTFDAAAFGSDKSAPIVIYGHGSDGWSAVAAVKSAVDAGFTNVRWMRTGWADWTNKKMPVTQ